MNGKGMFWRRWTGSLIGWLGAMALGGLLAVACGGKAPAAEPDGGMSGSPPGSAEPVLNAVYAAPDGYETGAGTVDYPCTIYRAIQKAEAGQTIYVRGGEYRLTRRIELEKVGTADRPYRLFAFPGEKPVFDFSDMGRNPGIRIGKGCYWHLKGIEIRNAYNDGVKIVDGSHNTFENCVSHHNGGNGFNMGYGHEVPGAPHPNPDGEKAAFNTFINCDAHHNFDWFTVNDGVPEPGTNADGFSVKSRSGRGNLFVGCRAWSNSDDAWDFYECGFAVQVIGCWAWKSGVWSDHVEMYRDRTRGGVLTEELFDGNGNGFKIGGGCLHNPARECNAASQGTHVLRNCISFGHPGRGFDQNNHQYGAWIENCLGFGNGTNFGFWTPNEGGTSWRFRNNVSFGGDRNDRFVIPGVVISADAGNTWNLTPGDFASYPSQFVSLEERDAEAPRGSDGSLPERFGRLKSGSIFIDRGVPTESIEGDGFRYSAISYDGPAPDMGAYEYVP